MAILRKNHPVWRYVSLILKILISMSLIYWITRHVRFESLFLFIQDHLIAVLGIFLLSLIHLANEFLRFYLVIRRGHFDHTVQKLVKIFFIGYAFRFLLPGGQGEVGKMLYINGRRSHRLAAYLIEKGSQVYILLIAFGLAINWLFPHYRLLGWGITGLLIIGTLVWKWLMRNRYLNRLIPDLLASRTFFLIEAALGALNIVIISMEYFLLLSRFEMGFIDVSAVVTVVLTVIMIPVSFAGLGLRETAASQLFSDFGVPKDIGIGIPFLIFTLNVALPAFIGVFVFLTNRIELHGVSLETFLRKRDT